MHAQASEIRSKVRGFCWLLFFHNFEGGKIFALDLMSLIVYQWRCEKNLGPEGCEMAGEKNLI